MSARLAARAPWVLGVLVALGGCIGPGLEPPSQDRAARSGPENPTMQGEGAGGNDLGGSHDGSSDAGASSILEPDDAGHDDASPRNAGANQL